MTKDYFMSLDGWGNLLTGLGPENSSLNVSFSGAYTRALSTIELENLFYSGGIAQIICTEIPADGLKNEISLHGETKDTENIEALVKDINMYTIFSNAWSSARAFGGALLVIDLDDGVDSLSEEVNTETVKEVRGLELFDRRDIQITPDCFSSDETSPYYGKIYRYAITKKDGKPEFVHASRCLWFAGDYISWHKKKDNAYFDGSVIQRTWGSLSKLGPAFEYVNKLLQRFNVLKFGIKGLAEKIAVGKESEIKTRLHIMKQSMSILNAAMFDADGEEIVSETISVNGLADILKQYFILVSAESRIPVNRLFTKLVGGLGDEGDSDEARYYDHVQHEQRRVLTDPIDTLLYYICLSLSIDFEKISWDFEPLKRYSKKELVEMQSAIIKDVTALIEWDIIDKAEARKVLTKLDNFSDLEEME